jgi:hypothetical protein
MGEQERGGDPMKQFRRALLLLTLGFPGLGASQQNSPKPELLDVRKIWDGAPHNAFTDLLRFKDRWFCVFREGQAHIAPDGVLRVLSSTDGDTWISESQVAMAGAGLRDAKICSTPDGKLMLSGAGVFPPGGKVRHQTFAWFSTDGRTWSEPQAIGDPDFWIWRVTWQKERAWGIGYATREESMIRLYSSADGKSFETHLATLREGGEPNEGSILFLEDGTALCLLRRDGKGNMALLGTAKAPYQEWTWKDLGLKVGGPQLLLLPDGRIVASGRLYNGGAHTGLFWLDPKEGKATEFLKLPSGGDTSYPGLVFHEGLLWVSYYSSHEGKTSIYRAKVRLPE